MSAAPDGSASLPSRSPGTQTFHQSSSVLVVLDWGAYRTLPSASKFFNRGVA